MRARPILMCAAAAMGAGGLAVARKGWRWANHTRRVTADLVDRLEQLQVRFEQGQLAGQESAVDAAGRHAALDERQAASDSLLSDLGLAVNSLAQQLVGLGDGTKDLATLAARLDVLEGRVIRLQAEAEDAGALAATAVAAADELEVLAPSLRELRRELLQLTRPVHPNGQHPPAERHPTA